MSNQRVTASEERMTRSGDGGNRVVRQGTINNTFGVVKPEVALVGTNKAPHYSSTSVSYDASPGMPCFALKRKQSDMTFVGDVTVSFGAVEKKNSEREMRDHVTFVGVVGVQTDIAKPWVSDINLNIGGQQTVRVEMGEAALGTFLTARPFPSDDIEAGKLIKKRKSMPSHRESGSGYFTPIMPFSGNDLFHDAIQLIHTKRDEVKINDISIARQCELKKKSITHETAAYVKAAAVSTAFTVISGLFANGLITLGDAAVFDNARSNYNTTTVGNLPTLPTEFAKKIGLLADFMGVSSFSSSMVGPEKQEAGLVSMLIYEALNPAHAQVKGTHQKSLMKTITSAGVPSSASITEFFKAASAFWPALGQLMLNEGASQVVARVTNVMDGDTVDTILL